MRRPSRNSLLTQQRQKKDTGQVANRSIQAVLLQLLALVSVLNLRACKNLMTTLSLNPLNPKTLPSLKAVTMLLKLLCAHVPAIQADRV